MRDGNWALFRFRSLVERKQDEAGVYSVGGREDRLRGAVIPPLTLHLQRNEGVRCLLLHELVEG